jgi:hypothetical protein
MEFPEMGRFERKFVLPVDNAASEPSGIRKNTLPNFLPSFEDDFFSARVDARMFAYELAF